MAIDCGLSNIAKAFSYLLMFREALLRSVHSWVKCWRWSKLSWAT